MIALADFYRTQFKVTIAVQLQYRVALVIWLIGGILQPVIYLVVWTTVARAQGGHVGRFTASDFAAYYLVLMLMNHATFTWVIYHFDTMVQQGALSPLLVRPIHPIHAHVAENLSFKLLTLSVMTPAATVIALTFHARFHTPVWALLAFVPATVCAIVLRFLVEWAISILAFWTTRMRAIDQMYFLTFLFLSGSVAPLDLLPGPIRVLSALLPFRWILSFPVELLLGHVSSHDAIVGLCVQAAWIAALALLGWTLWRYGLRRYAAVGA